MKEIMGFESSQLCFNKDEFFKDEFSVDGFVLRYRQQSGLESLRTDLGMYLKVLRSSMIDLINRDYADFVNLSSNLVGLDASISKLEMPLGQLKEEILSVRRSFDDLLEQTGWRLSRLHEVRAQKQYLRLLGSLPGYLDRLEALLDSTDDQESPEQDGDALERAACEYNQLTYALGHCGGGAALVARLKPRADMLAARLSDRLRSALLAGLQERDAERLAHVLRVFATLDQVPVAEALFRDRVVEPYMEDVISQQALRDSPRGLKGLLENVLQFVPDRAQLLVTVTRREHGAQTGPRYDFLVNSVWPCIVQKLDEELPSIFAPGNPNAFYERYTACMEFVQQFERACGTAASVTRLRAHESYDSFMKKWNLPVYYQIRLQEVGGALEEALASGAAGDAVWIALQRCWSRGVFLRPLTHRLWQLTLQIISRYGTWLTSRLAAEEKTKELPLEDCVQYLTELGDLDGKLNTFIDGVVLPMVPGLSDEAVQAMRDSLATGRARLALLPDRVTRLFTGRLLTAASEPMRAVLDIPRLYRRTNRDPPTSASVYVTAMVTPLTNFSRGACAGLDSNVTAGYLTGVATQLCSTYREKVSQVLTSVQKMEESLRKLKKSRAGGTAAAPAGGTDDEKIRRQLALDVGELGRQLAGLGLDTDGLTEYTQLLALVTGADVAV